MLNLPTPRLRWLAALTLALVGPMIHAGTSWVVQVGAYGETPNAQTQSLMQALRALPDGGPVSSSINARGLNVISVGPFADRADAQAALYDVQAIVPDAYIRQVSSAAAPASQGTEKDPMQTAPEGQGVAPVAIANADSEAAMLLNQLPADDRRNVVMLDGRLHYKVGDRFTPLAEYLSARQAQGRDS